MKRIISVIGMLVITALTAFGQFTNTGKTVMYDSQTYKFLEPNLVPSNSIVVAGTPNNFTGTQTFYAITLGGVTQTNWPSGGTTSITWAAGTGLTNAGTAMAVIGQLNAASILSLSKADTAIQTELDPVWGVVSNTVRAGAALGATAIQTELDPVWTGVSNNVAYLNKANNFTGIGTFGFLNYTNMINGQTIQNGLVDSSKLTLFYDYTNRTVTLTPTTTNGFELASGGVMRTYTNAVTSAAAGTNSGSWYFYFNSAGSFVAQQSAWSLLTDAAITYTIWDDSVSNNVLVVDEKHQNLWPNTLHSWSHQTVGTKWASGLGMYYTAVDNNNLGDAAGSNVCLTMLSGTIWDDDLPHTITQSLTPGNPLKSMNLGTATNAVTVNTNTAGRIPFLYKDSAGWHKTYGNGPFPYLWNTNNNHQQYVNSSGVITDVPDAGFGVVWVLANGDYTNPVFFISHPVTYTSTALAQSGATFASLASTLGGLPSPDILVCYRLIFVHHYTGAIQPASVKYSKLRDVADYRNYSSAVISLNPVAGPAGPGVPSGGNTGDLLAKSSDNNYDTIWTNYAAQAGTSQWAAASADGTWASNGVVTLNGLTSGWNTASVDGAWASNGVVTLNGLTSGWNTASVEATWASNKAVSAYDIATWASNGVVTLNGLTSGWNTASVVATWSSNGVVTLNGLTSGWNTASIIATWSSNGVVTLNGKTSTWNTASTVATWASNGVVTLNGQTNSYAYLGKNNTYTASNNFTVLPTFNGTGLVYAASTFTLTNDAFNGAAILVDVSGGVTSYYHGVYIPQSGTSQWAIASADGTWASNGVVTLNGKTSTWNTASVNATWASNGVVTLNGLTSGWNTASTIATWASNGVVTLNGLTNNTAYLNKDNTYSAGSIQNFALATVTNNATTSTDVVNWRTLTNAIVTLAPSSSVVVSNLSYTGTTIATDASKADIYKVTVTNDVTIANPTAGTDGRQVTWWVKQDASGNHTVALGGNFVIPTSSSNPLAWSTNASTMDIFVSVYDATAGKWYVTRMIPGY